MVIFYKSHSYYVLVPVQCISVTWTLAAHLVFSSYLCCLQNPFKAPELTEKDEQEASEEGAFTDAEACDDQDIGVE